MMQSRTKRIIVSVSGCSAALALAVGLSGMRAAGKIAAEGKAAVPAEQLIASVRTAVAAKPGDVRAVDVESEGGKTLCEVEIRAQDGKTYEVEVDVATNAVIEIEEDND